MPKSFAPAAPAFEISFGRFLARLISWASTVARRLVLWALPQGRGESRIIGLVGIGIVLFIGTITTLVLREINSFERTASEKHTAQMVDAAAVQFGKILSQVDKAMRRTGKAIEEHQDFQRLAVENAAGQIPVDLLKNFFFVDVDGRMRISAMGSDEAGVQLDLSDRDYFRIHVERRDLDSHVGRPIIGKLHGDQLIPISRAVRRPNGELMGVLVAMIAASSLEAIWQDIGLGPDDTLKLIGVDGRAWLNWPHTVHPGEADESADPGPVVTRPLAGWPMRLVAGVNRGTIGQQTEPVRRMILLSSLVGTFVVAGFGLLLIKCTSHMVRDRAAAAQARDLLQETIEALPAGVMLYDAEERLQLFNSVGASLSPVTCRPGSIGKTYETLIREIRKGRDAQGLADPDDWVAQQISRFRNKGQRGLSQLADGRWIEKYERATPSGGTVGLRIDVTESKNLEIEARQARDLASAERATAAKARDLLQETIDALPAGVVLYDYDGRLLLFNSLAASISPALMYPEAIGSTYDTLVKENAKRRQANGLGDQDQWIAEQISRFRNKGQRGLRQLADGRWIEMYERPTPSGGTVGLRIDVTESKNLEIEARRARDLLQETIEALPAGVVVYDSEDHLLLYNSLAASIAPAIICPGAIGKTCEALVRETAKEREAQGLGNQDEWAAQQISRMRNNTGQRGLSQLADGRWFEMYEQPTPSGGTVGLRTDVTALKNLEIEARRTRDLADAMQARMVAAIDAVPVEFIEFGPDRRVILANRAARTSQGWIGDPTGKTQRELLIESLNSVRERIPGDEGILVEASPESDAWIDRRVASLEATGTFEFTRRNGEVGRFYANDMPGGGRVLVRVDITEMKQREAQLAAEMERLNSLVESTRSPILMLDTEGRVVVANHPTVKALGVKGQTILGQRFKDLSFAGFDTATVEQWTTSIEAMRTAIDGDRPRPADTDCSYVGSDGEKRQFRLTANPVEDEGGKLRYIVLIAIDDTERRNTEIRLFDAARLSNLGEMASGMAHEINQPLAVIGLAAESLREEIDMPEAASMAPELAAFVKQKIDRISGQVERASGIVRALRTVARKPTNTAVPFDLADATRVGGDLLQQQITVARVKFTLDLPTPGPMVLGEANRLQQVLINLVLNARDALLDRPDLPLAGSVGHIALSVAATPSGGAVLTVEDDGPGIPAHVLPRLFEPFFTTKPTGKGTGLGLSISYNIVKGMGGEITAGNRPEGGARFRISLPSAMSLGHIA